jgi:hypothetical protein
MPAPSGSTPRLALPYPIPDDPVDVPRDIKALADKLDGLGALSPPLVTTIPSAGAEGDEIRLVVAGQGNTAVWRLLCSPTRANDPAYPWIFMGGLPLAAVVETSETRPAGAGYGDLATVGPTLTLPAKGYYDISGSAAVNATSNFIGAASVVAGASAPSASNDIVAAMGPSTAALTGATAGRTIRRVFTTVVAVKLQYNAVGAPVTFANRWLWLAPVHLGP